MTDSFFSSRLNKSKNSEHGSFSDDSGSSWFNESWRKFQQLIEERKEKAAQQKSYKELQQIASVVEARNNAGTSINDEDGQEYDVISTSYFDQLQESLESSPDTPTNQLLEECVESRLEHGAKVESEPEIWLNATEPDDLPEEDDSLFRSPPPGIPSKDDDDQPKSVLQHIKTHYLPLIWIWNATWSQLYYAFAILMVVISLLLACASPLPSFINGFIFGTFSCIFLLSVLLVMVFNMIFIQKKPEPSKLQDKSQANQASPRKDAGEMSKDWMLEYLSVDDFSAHGKLEDTEKKKKTQPVYVRLDGTNIRLSTPKPGMKRSQLLQTDIAKIPMVSQRYYDLSKAKNKRLLIWLPKNIRNKKKYMWSKKFPLILEFDEKKAGMSKVVKLVLFVYTMREKEEWYQRFRRALFWKESEIGSKDRLEVSSMPQTPEESESLSSDQEKPRRTQSLDLGAVSNESSISSRDYDKYMHSIITDEKLISNDSSALLWFNALLGRVFFDFLTHKHWSNWASVKIQRKLSRIKLPYFVQTLTLQSIDLGPNLPRFLRVPKPPVIDEKGLWIDFEVSYSGGFNMSLETKVNLMKLKDQGSAERELKPMKALYTELSDSDEDSIVSTSDEEDSEEGHSLDDGGKQKLLKFVDKIASSKYFQSATEMKYVRKAMEEVSNTPLVLSVNVLELKGILSINIPQPPTDRLWYGFRGKPHLLLSAKPRLGLRQVSLHHVLEWIEKKLIQVFCKVLVIPNMDDVALQIMIGNVQEADFVSSVP